MWASLAHKALEGDSLVVQVVIATDMYGFVLVTELRNSCASIFDKDGIIHSFDFGHDQFLFPCQTAVSPTGAILCM